MSLSIAWPFSLFTCVATYLLFRRRTHKTFPPSPPGLPFLGNLLDVPQTGAWRRFAEWSRELGSPIISINLLGTKLIVINDAAVAEELLEKRSNIYCSRPRLPFVNEAAGFRDWNWGFSGDPEFWKPARREFEVHTRPAMARHYHKKELHMARQTMHRLLNDPRDFMEHCRFASGFFILDMMYGMDDPNEAESYIDRFDRGSESFNRAIKKNVVDVLPWAQHIPLWLSYLPGFGWRQEVQVLKEWGLSMRDATFDWYFLHKVRGSNSVMDDLLSRLESSIPDGSSRTSFAKDVIGVAYVAGTTITGAFRFIILVMVLFPEVQQRAREQIDAVVGADRLPDFDDKPRLPYIVALCKEIIRWTSPVSIPHSPVQDDYYNGYFIPKGSRIIPNTWAILHDPSIYPSPEDFSPIRFLTEQGELDPKVPDPIAGFGSGRRLCPGRFVALDEMFIFAASLISMFNIKRVVSDSGEELTPTQSCGEGLVGQPQPFPCTIEPRSQRTGELLGAYIGTLIR